MAVETPVAAVMWAPVSPRRRGLCAWAKCMYNASPRAWALAVARSDRPVATVAGLVCARLRKTRKREEAEAMGGKEEDMERRRDRRGAEEARERKKRHEETQRA